MLCIHMYLYLGSLVPDDARHRRQRCELVGGYFGVDPGQISEQSRFAHRGEPCKLSPWYQNHSNTVDNSFVLASLSYMYMYIPSLAPRLRPTFHCYTLSCVKQRKAGWSLGMRLHNIPYLCAMLQFRVRYICQCMSRVGLTVRSLIPRSSSLGTRLDFSHRQSRLWHPQSLPHQIPPLLPRPLPSAGSVLDGTWPDEL